MAVSEIKNILKEIPTGTFSSGDDCDNYRATGFYRCSGTNASGGSHMPTSSAFVLIVINRGGQEADQLAFRGDGIWVRATGSSGWGAWKKCTPT